MPAALNALLPGIALPKLDLIADPSIEGFRNNATALTVSALHVRRYSELAASIAATAIGSTSLAEVPWSDFNPTVWLGFGTVSVPFSTPHRLLHFQAVLSHITLAQGVEPKTITTAFRIVIFEATRKAPPCRKSTCKTRSSKWRS